MQTNKTAARQITGKAMIGGAGLGALWALKNEIDRRRQIDQFRDELKKLLELDLPGPKGPGAGDILSRMELEGDKFEEATKDLKWVTAKDLKDIQKSIPEWMGGKRASKEASWERMTTPLALKDIPVLRHATSPIAIALPLAILAFGGSKKLVGQLLRQAGKLDDSQRISQEEKRIQDFIETGYPDESMKGVSDKFASLDKEAGKEWWEGVKSKLSGWGTSIEDAVTGPALAPAMLAATLMLILGSKARERSQLRRKDSITGHKRELTRGIKQDSQGRDLDKLRKQLLEGLRAGQSAPKVPELGRGTDEAFVF